MESDGEIQPASKTNSSLEKGFLRFVADILDVPVESITLDTAYESIPEWDSVMHLRLTLEIGAEYGAEIPVDEIALVKTLGDFYKYVRKDIV